MCRAPSDRGCDAPSRGKCRKRLMGLCFHLWDLGHRLVKIQHLLVLLWHPVCRLLASIRVWPARLPRGPQKPRSFLLSGALLLAFGAQTTMSEARSPPGCRAARRLRPQVGALVPGLEEVPADHGIRCLWVVPAPGCPSRPERPQPRPGHRAADGSPPPAASCDLD